MVKLAYVMLHLRDLDLWGALVIILFAICLSVLTFFDTPLFSFFVGPLLFPHLMGVIGGFWIALFTPVYYELKHRRPHKIKAWLRIHTLGNLVALSLITVHFTYRVTSVSFIGTGFALFVATLTLVVTGLFYRFNILQRSKKHFRFIHISMTTAFYLILIIHILSQMIRL